MIISQKKKKKIEQLEHLRSEDTPPPPHNYPSYWVILDPKSKEDKVKVTNLKWICQNFKFLNFETNFTRDSPPEVAWRCANMKWIWRVLLKIQRGHDSVDRWTDGQTDKVKPVYPPFNFVEAEGIITTKSPRAYFTGYALFHWGAVAETLITVKCRYNVVNFLWNTKKKHPMARPNRQARGGGVFWGFKFWFIFNFRHCNYVCNIMLYWTVL